jgi:hypothetical protein
VLADRVGYFWAINLGFSVAVPLGGWLADQGFVLLFALEAATSLAFAVVVVLRVPETRPPRLPGAPPSSMRHVLTDRILLALVACVVGLAAVYLQAYSTVPIVVADDGLGASGYGVVLGHMGAVVVWTPGEILQAGLLGGLVAAMAPPHVRGRYLGVFGTAFGVAGFLAPLVGTQALEHLGQGRLFVGCAVVGGASAIGLTAVSAAASRAAKQGD